MSKPANVRTLLWVATSVILAASASPALAAGYDTPILYTARHMGMGGTAIGYVNDASATFHNPAGLARMKSGNLLLHVTNITGYLQAAPEWQDEDGDGLNDLAATRTDPGHTQVPFLAGGGRITDWMTAGLGLYPVASATGEYHYTQGSDSVHDKTKLLFLEVAPTLAFNLPYNLELGVGYRIERVSLERLKHKSGATEFSVVDANAVGYSFSGIRLGLLWRPLDWLSVGAVWRNKTTTEISADTATVYNQETGEATVEFVLPMKMGFGVRADLGKLSLTSDFDYDWNSQVVGQNFMVAAKDDPTDINPIYNHAFWQNNFTIRGGAEYAVTDKIAARLGYIFDSQAANPEFPSAFGTPPADTHSATAGVGYDGGPWQVNLAYAYRRGGVTVEGQDDSPSTPKGQPDDKFCAFCAYPGDYDLLLHGMYLDFSWSFGGEEASAEVIPEAPLEEPPLKPLAEEPAPAEDATPVEEPAPAEDATPAEEPAPAEDTATDAP